MNVVRILLPALLFGVFGVSAEEPTGPIAGDYEVTVESGAVETWSGDLSGTGRIVKNGGGTLVLSGTNTFSGGILVNKGSVRIDAEKAIGSGTVTLSPASAAVSDVAQLYINCAGTFDNDIVQTAQVQDAWDATTDEAADILILSDTTANVVFNGDITSAGDISIRPKPANTGNADGTGATTTFNGALSAPGKTIVFQFYGKPTINGRVTCNLLTANSAWSGGAELKLANAENAIGAIRLRNGNVRAASPGALGGALLKVETAWNNSSKCNFYLEDNPQFVAGVVDASGSTLSSQTRSDCGMISSGYPVTLTITGATDVASCTAKQNINGALNLCVDAPNFTQTFSTRAHTTRGNITVKNGTMKVANTATFCNVPALTVEAGGTLMVESTTNACFGGVKLLTVEGALKTTRNDTFTSGLSLRMGTGASLELPAESTLTVGALIVNGAFLPAGTYTGQHGITGGSVKVEPGEYVIDVPAGETNTVDMLFTESVPSIRKIGAGGLILANPANTFAGGLDIDAGSVIVNGAETLGFGTGPVRINGTGDTVCRLSFLGNTTFTNDIIHAKSSVAYPGIFIATLKQVTFTGAITSTDDMYIWNDRNGSNESGQGPTTVFKGPVTAADKTLTLRTYGTMDFYDRIVCGKLTCTPNWSAMGKVLLRSSENAIAVFEDCAPAVECYAENVLLGTALNFNTTGWSDGGPKLLMGANHQSVASIGTSGTSLSTLMKSNRHFHRVYASDDNTPLTLTLTGEATSRSTYAGIESNISLVLDAEDYPNFVQTFNGLDSTTKGNVVVKCGTLAIGGDVKFANVPEVVVEAGGTLRISNTTAAFPKVEKVVVDGKLEVTTSQPPFIFGDLSLELGADAECTFPENMTITCSSILVDGRPLLPGTYTSETLPQLKQGTVVASMGGDLTWTAGGADDAMATAANWNDAAACEKLATGAVGVKFAEAGERAELGQALAVTHIDFDAPGDFTLAGMGDAAALAVGTLGIEVAAGNAAKTYSVEDLALSVSGTQTWTLPTTNETLRFKNAFTADEALVNALVVEGAGRMVFEGTNVLKGGLKLSAPSKVHDGFTGPTLKVTGLLATPGHVDQGAAGNNESSIYMNMDHDGTGIPDAPWGLRLVNGEIEKPVAIYEQMGERCIVAEVGTTNVLKGELAFVGTEWTRAELLNRSVVTCRGGIKSPNHGLRFFGAGTLFIRDRPVVFKNYSGLNPTGNTTVDVGVAGNDFNSVCVGYETGFPQVRFSVSGAMTNGMLIVGFNSGYLDSLATHVLSAGTYTADLMDGTTQRCEKVAMSARSVLKGQYPAMLEVYGNLPRGTDEEKAYKISGKVQEGVGVRMCGAGTLLLDGGELTSCGDLAVSSGTLEIAAGTTWKNGRRTFVTGTGVLKVNAGDAFAAGQMDIYVSGDDWKLDIPEGQTLVVHSLVDQATGRAYAPGAYGNAASGAANTSLAAHFTGNGRLQLRRTGTTLSFR